MEWAERMVWCGIFQGGLGWYDWEQSGEKGGCSY